MLDSYVMEIRPEKRLQLSSREEHSRSYTTVLYNCYYTNIPLDQCEPEKHSDNDIPNIPLDYYLINIIYINTTRLLTDITI